MPTSVRDRPAFGNAVYGVTSRMPPRHPSPRFHAEPPRDEASSSGGRAWARPPAWPADMHGPARSISGIPLH